MWKLNFEREKYQRTTGERGLRIKTIFHQSFKILICIDIVSLSLRICILYMEELSICH
jgi:hypothetical protein